MKTSLDVNNTASISPVQLLCCTQSDWNDDASRYVTNAAGEMSQQLAQS